jgi:hypothetical protein
MTRPQLEAYIMEVEGCTLEEAQHLADLVEGARDDDTTE